MLSPHAHDELKLFNSYYQELRKSLGFIKPINCKQADV